MTLHSKEEGKTQENCDMNNEYINDEVENDSFNPHSLKSIAVIRKQSLESRVDNEFSYESDIKATEYFSYYYSRTDGIRLIDSN